MNAETRKVALVTGASRGIGRAVAISLANEGYHLILTGRDMDALRETATQLKPAGETAEIYRLDVSSETSVDAVKAALAESGTVPDVLVNNSGIGGPSGDLWKLDGDDWRETLDVNVTGTFLCCRAFLPGMIARGSGVVINVGSATGKAVLSGRTAYAGSKAALVAITRTLATEAGPHGVRVNLISPANIDGERLRWVIQARAEAEGMTPADVEDRMTRQAALKRFVDPGEVADVVVFLASNRASAITGEDINVSAGYVMF